jgi:hypothetical protein
MGMECNVMNEMNVVKCNEQAKEGLYPPNEARVREMRKSLMVMIL